MKNQGSLRLIALTLSGLFSLAATAKVPPELNGTWVMDAKQTEERLKKVGPPARNAQWLPAILLRQCVTTITFEGETMVMDPISPNPMVQSFRLEPQPNKVLTYTIQAADGGKDTLTISFVNAQSITVKSEKMGLDEYGVWTRGKKPNRQTAQTDFKQAFDVCASALNNVPFVRAGAR